MARAFVAVVPPEQVLDAIAAEADAIAAALGGVAHLTRRDHWHLTLAFLGDDADLDRTAGLLEAHDLKAEHVQLGGVGAFASPRRARTVYLGVAQGEQWLLAAATHIAGLLAPLGYEARARDFQPHLTLGRLAVPRDVRPLAERHRGPVGGPWRVGSVDLIESRLGSRGAQHRLHRRLVVP